VSASPVTASHPDLPVAAASPSLLEQCTKPFLFVSLAAAIWSATRGLSVVWPVLRFVVPVAFAVAWAAARFKPVIVRQILLGTYYLIPAIFTFVVVVFPAGNWVVWMAPLCGMILATTPIRRWAMPATLKLPLVFWALVVAATWPIIVFREADFLWARIHPITVWGFGAVAAATILGILWLDSLFASFPAVEPSDGLYERQVVLPMAAGWLIAGLVAMYQMFVDVTFLNRGQWAALHRATGTLADANPFGVISAMWGPVIFAIAIERWSGWRRLAGAAALPLSWLAVWASGSRSSLPIVVLALVIIVSWYLRATESRRGVRLAAVAVTLVLLAAAAGITSRRSGVDSPIARATSYFAPRWSLEWVSGVATKLERRDGYGTVAAAVIRDFPHVGIGVGAFHSMVPLYAWKVSSTYLPPDNAQNWFRHQLAEFGIIGSLGWMIWVAWFLALLAFGRPTTGRPLTSGVVRGVLVGFGLISLVGVPGQDVAVVFTFWALAFWSLALLEPGYREALGWRVVRPAWWIVVWLAVLGYSGATAYVGWTDLRPPVRNAAANLDYSYGFYPPQQSETFRWAAKQAVAVLPTPSDRKWLQVKVWVERLNIARKPVDVRVWTDRHLIVRAQLSSVDPVTRYFKVPEGHSRVMLETWVSRALRPRDFGVNDNRELGLIVDWHFLDALPPGAVAEN
jgi:hypothetical protein